MIFTVKIISCFLMGIMIATILIAIRNKYKNRRMTKREQTVDAEQQIEDAISPYIEPEIPPSWPAYDNYRRMRALRNAITPYDEVRQTQALHIETDKEDFTPKKRMKVHKLDQHIRKETFVGPGVYAREVDHSTVVINSEYYLGIGRRNR